MSLKISLLWDSSFLKVIYLWRGTVVPAHRSPHTASVINRTLLYRRQQHIFDKLQSCLRIKTAWCSKEVATATKPTPFISVCPALKANTEQYVNLQYFSNHRLFKPCKILIVIFDYSPKCTNMLPFHNHNTVITPALVPCPSDVFRKQRELNRNVLFMRCITFPTSFSLVYLLRAYTFWNFSLFSSLSSISFCSLFLFSFPFQFFSLTFLQELPRCPNGSCEYWVRFKIHFNQGNLSVFIYRQKMA